MPTDPTPTPADIEAARYALYSDGVAGMPDRVARALATARAEADAAGYARGRAEGLREAAQWFRWAYAAVVALAKVELAETNATCGDDWPRGQTWDQLAGTSRSVFLRRARERLGIDHDGFLAPIRSGMVDVDDLYEGVPTPGPRVGDVVTAENVGAMPVGTIVRWEHLGEEWRAERVEPDLWLAGGIEYDDEEIADACGPVTTIAYLPPGERDGGGS